MSQGPHCHLRSHSSCWGPGCERQRSLVVELLAEGAWARPTLFMTGSLPPGRGGGIGPNWGSERSAHSLGVRMPKLQQPPGRRWAFLYGAGTGLPGRKLRSFTDVLEEQSQP